MIELVLGLPGTGKSTFVKQYHNIVRFDLGHNAFKSEAEREKFYNKAQRLTTTLLDSYADVKKVYWDTYPEYFDLNTVRKHINDIHITFAIPSQEEMDFVIDRVGARDGYDSEFYHLYKKRGHQWQRDWMDIYHTWYTRLGKKNVTLISRYDA